MRDRYIMISIALAVGLIGFQALADEGRFYTEGELTGDDKRGAVMFMVANEGSDVWRCKPVELSKKASVVNKRGGSETYIYKPQGNVITKRGAIRALAAGQRVSDCRLVELSEQATVVNK